MSTGGQNVHIYYFRAGLENLYDVMLKAAISQERGTRIKVIRQLN